MGLISHISIVSSSTSGLSSAVRLDRIVTMDHSYFLPSHLPGQVSKSLQLEPWERDSPQPVWESGSEKWDTNMTWNEDWASAAQCKQARPDELFVRGAAQNRAKLMCAGCPVKTECLAEALDNEIEWGVWGGMTERERRAVLKKRPNVTSWRRLFEAAQAEHEQGRTAVVSA